MGPGTSFTSHLAGLDPHKRAAEALVASARQRAPYFTPELAVADECALETRCAAAACAAGATWSALVTRVPRRQLRNSPGTPASVRPVGAVVLPPRPFPCPLRPRPRFRRPPPLLPLLPAAPPP